MTIEAGRRAGSFCLLDLCCCRPQCNQPPPPKQLNNLFFPSFTFSKSHDTPARSHRGVSHWSAEVTGGTNADATASYVSALASTWRWFEIFWAQTSLPASPPPGGPMGLSLQVCSVSTCQTPVRTGRGYQIGGPRHTHRHTWRLGVSIVRTCVCACVWTLNCVSVCVCVWLGTGETWSAEGAFSEYVYNKESCNIFLGRLNLPQ